MILEFKRKATREELIERIEELEKELENWKFTAKYVEENYIDKCKIIKKIHELENEKRKYFEKQIIQGRIDLLEELLEV